jgi:AcrR family transcriptional regulator
MVGAMSRWEPNAAERLVGAAMELFVERGYDSVTVLEIAERAGLTKRTYFRHFADKREVLFAGQEALRRAVVDAIAGAPDSATPLAAIDAGLTAFAAGIDEERRGVLAQRQAIIGGNPDLRERELAKRAALTAAMGEALGARGVTEPTASLAADIGALALGAAYELWLEPENRHTLSRLAHRALRDLAAAAQALIDVGAAQRPVPAP